MSKKRDRPLKPHPPAVGATPYASAPYGPHFLIAALLLCASVIAVFQVTLNFPLLTFGDRQVVSGNPVVTRGFTAPGLEFVLLDPAAGYWKPVTWMSHMLDSELGGGSTLRHGMNVLLHLMSAWLFYFALHGLTQSPGRSFAAAAFFALHPLRAQSVVWVAERQGLLAGFFSFLTLAAWMIWKRRASGWAYVVALAACGLAMMSNPAAVVLPLILMLLEFWPLESGRNWRWREKLPFAAATFLTSAVWAVRFASFPAASAPWRVDASFWPALFNTFWPAYLTPVAGVAVPGYGAPAGWSALAFLIGGLVILGDRHRYLVTGVLWFILALAASVTMSEAGWHSYADRSTYFAHAGLGIAIVWLGAAWLGERAAACLAVPLALLMAWLCYAQLGYWRDDTTLVARAFALNPANANALSLMGHSYLEQHEPERAIGAFRQAVSVDPKSAELRLQLAGALQAAGQQPEALEQIDRAIRLAPASGSAYFHRGSILRSLGQNEGAREAFLRALDLGVPAPLRQGALLSLGLMESQGGQDARAIEHLALVLEREPGQYQARKAMAMIFLRQERWREALRELERLGAEAGRNDAEVRLALETARGRLAKP